MLDKRARLGDDGFTTANVIPSGGWRGVNEPSLPTIKRLFAVSKNRCAFPKCPQLLVDAGSGKVVGRICHIKGKSPGGPRHDTKQSAEERNGFENLMLLCPIHHDVVDADEESYTVERLQKMKANHENPAGQLELSDEQAAQFLVAQNPTVQVKHNTAIQGSNITTINQMGGQAAHSITNVGPQPRMITAAAGGALLEFLQGQPPLSVTVVALMGDPESYQLAEALKGVLQRAGWQCDGINQAMFAGLPRGVVLKMSAPVPSMVALGEALLRLGIACHGELDSKAGKTEVIVGANL